MIISNFKYLHRNDVLAFLLDLGSDVALFCHIVSDSKVVESPHFTHHCHLAMQCDQYQIMM